MPFDAESGRDNSKAMFGVELPTSGGYDKRAAGV